jgi:hypothetical protein
MMRSPVLRFFVLASVSLVAACGAQTEESTPSGASPAGSPEAPSLADAEDMPRPSFCTGPSGQDVGAALFAGLAPSKAPDYLARRQYGGELPGGLTEELHTVEERGTLCSGATDATACKEAYAALKPPARFGDHLCFTRGDGVGCLATKTDAMAFLGTIDSVEEAIFIAQYDGYGATCNDYRIFTRATQLADGTFRLALLKGTGCNSETMRALVDVSQDGNVVERDAKQVDVAQGCP